MPKGECNSNSGGSSWSSQREVFLMLNISDLMILLTTSIPMSQFPSVMIMSPKHPQWQQLLSSFKTHPCCFFLNTAIHQQKAPLISYSELMPISIFHENTVVNALLLSKIWEMYFHPPMRCKTYSSGIRDLGKKITRTSLWKKYKTM